MKIKFSVFEDSNERIDKFLSAIFFDFSRSYFSNLIKKEKVFLNNIIPKPGTILKKKDLIEIEFSKPKKLELKPENITLKIIYEDSDIIVINKPSGMVVHPAPGHENRTLVNALLFHCKDLSGINDVLRPGIVHRLDKDTSGLLIVAKTNKSHMKLVEMFQKREIKKYYKALVIGKVIPEKNKIESKIGRHKINRLKFSSFTNHGKIAITNYKVEKYYNNFTLLDINIETGRTHQIRVHFSEMGYPLVGDYLYGEKKNKKSITKILMPFVNRTFLHAYKLTFNHPIKNNLLKFETDLPKELQLILEKIEEENL